MLKRVALPELPDGPEELCSMIHWLRWNEMIEKRVDSALRFRLEDEAPALIVEIGRSLDRLFEEEEIDSAIKSGREIRENPHRTGEALFQAADLRGLAIFDEVAAKAEEYGYDIDEPIS